MLSKSAWFGGSSSHFAVSFPGIRMGHVIFCVLIVSFLVASSLRWLFICLAFGVGWLVALVRWFLDLFFDWLVGWYVGLLVGCMCARYLLYCRLVHFGCLLAGSVAWLAVCLGSWLSEWMGGRAVAFRGV